MADKKNNNRENKWFFINQAWLVKNVRFFLFLAALAILYIYNGHHAEKAIKDINKTSKEMNDLQYEFKMVRKDWMFMTKQSEVVKAVETFGIKEIKEPPMTLEDTAYKNEKVSN
jgi:hypothetical protein